MPITKEGWWFPELSPKQLEIYNCYSRYLLASGPKKSSKTWANLHRLVRHAIEIPNARVGMFAKTIKNATSGGIWNDFCEIILPEWFNAKQTKYTSRKSDKTYGPRQHSQTRMSYLKLKNRFGGESEVQLHSIDNENEVEAIAKGTRFSCFYFSELSNFRNRLVFDITTDQLRMPGISFSDHQFVADTNPSDEGEDSWIYKLWFALPNKKDKTPAEEFLCKHLKLIQVMIEDNPYLSEDDVQDLYARFAHDPDLAARYLRGEWVRASKDAIFIKQFQQDTHVIGDASSIDSKEWSVILPSEHCHTLITGFDLGDRFHSAHIIEPVETEVGRTYCVLDEINQIDDGVKMGIAEFCEMFMARYNLWMDLICGKDAKKRAMFEWHHWADSAALTNWRAGSDAYDQNLVARYTEGDVVLNAAPKFPGSIAKRVNLVKVLLHERRLLISASCINTIAMFKSLRSGTAGKVVQPNQLLGHVWDSLSYALAAEEPWLLLSEVTETKDSGGLISLKT